MADDISAKKQNPRKPSAPKPPKAPANNRGKNSPTDDEDFFDEISSQIDSLKAPSEDPNPANDIVEVALGANDSGSKKKGAEPNGKRPAKTKSSSASTSTPVRTQSKNQRHPSKQSTKKPSSTTVAAAKNQTKPKQPKAAKKPSTKVPTQADPVKSGAASKRARPIKKSTASKPEQKKATPKKTKAGGRQASKQAPKTTKDRKPDSAASKNAIPPDASQNKGGIDFDDFLADVSADIEKVKDRFETTNSGDSDSGADGSEIVEYDMDEWFLPEEQDQTKPAKTTPVQKQSDQKKSEQKEVPPVTAAPKNKPPAQKKSSLTRTAPKKQPALKKLKPLPSIKEGAAQSTIKTSKHKPTPKATTAGLKIQKSAKAAAAATSKKVAPPPIQLFEDLQDTEDTISHHLVTETPRPPKKRRPIKLMVGVVMIVVLFLSASVVYLRDPFGFFRPTSTPPTKAETVPTTQAEPSEAHKIPQRTSSGKQANSPIPVETSKPKPATVTVVAAAKPKPPGPNPDAPPSQPEKKVAPPPVTLVQKKATPAPDLSITNVSVSEPKPTAPPRHEQINEFLDGWAAAWEKTAGPNGDFTAYMACYSDSFMARGMNKAAWKKDKQLKNSRKKWIAINIKDVSIIQQHSPDHVKVTFSQEYRSSNYSSTSPKTLVLTKESKGWKIIGVSP